VPDRILKPRRPAPATRPDPLDALTARLTNLHIDPLHTKLDELRTRMANLQINPGPTMDELTQLMSGLNLSPALDESI